MKALTIFANVKSLILLVLLFGYFGCTPETIKPNPDPTPTPTKPKVTVNSVNPASRKLVYDGSANPQTTVVIDFTVTGATTPATVNGAVVLNGLFTSPPISSGQKFVIQASNAQGPTSETVDIAVEIDPVMALLTTRRFLTTKLVRDGVPFASSIEYDDTTTFSLDSKVSVHRGSGGFWATWPISLSNNKTIINGWSPGGTEILKLTADSLVYRTYTGNNPVVEYVTHLVRLNN